MVHLFSIPEYVQLCFCGGTCINLVTSHCCSVGICIALCVALHWFSRAIQSSAYISGAKYEHSPFFWKLCWNYFQIIFDWEQNQMENKWKYSNFSIKTTTNKQKNFKQIVNILLPVFQCKQVWAMWLCWSWTVKTSWFQGKKKKKNWCWVCLNVRRKYLLFAIETCWVLLNVGEKYLLFAIETDAEYFWM